MSCAVMYRRLHYLETHARVHLKFLALPIVFYCFVSVRINMQAQELS